VVKNADKIVALLCSEFDAKTTEAPQILYDAKNKEFSLNINLKNNESDFKFEIKFNADGRFLNCNRDIRTPKLGIDLKP